MFSAVGEKFTVILEYKDISTEKRNVTRNQFRRGVENHAVRMTAPLGGVLAAELGYWS